MADIVHELGRNGIQTLEEGIMESFKRRLAKWGIILSLLFIVILCCIGLSIEDRTYMGSIIMMTLVGFCTGAVAWVDVFLDSYWSIRRKLIQKNGEDYFPYQELYKELGVGSGDSQNREVKSSI